jgi:PEGA domain
MGKRSLPQVHSLQQESPSAEPDIAARMLWTMRLSFKFCLLSVIACLTMTGCVHRRVTINSNPPGALVKVDGKDIGYTPASFDFTWYGTREVKLLKDGYETHTEHIEIDSPWYQKFPMDFFSDNFLGQHVTDHRQFGFQLRPKRQDHSSDVMNRAKALRSEAQHGQ